MKKSIDVAEKIVKYFDSSVLVGSILLVQENLITYSDINNINVAVLDSNPKEGSRLFRVIDFLKDMGFKETSTFPTHVSSNLAFNSGSFEFENSEYDLPIHIIKYKEAFDVMAVEEIISEKFSRGTRSDLDQIDKAVVAKKLLIED